MSTTKNYSKCFNFLFGGAFFYLINLHLKYIYVLFFFLFCMHTWKGTKKVYWSYFMELPLWPKIGRAFLRSCWSNLPMTSMSMWHCGSLLSILVTHGPCKIASNIAHQTSDNTQQAENSNKQTLFNRQNTADSIHYWTNRTQQTANINQQAEESRQQHHSANRTQQTADIIQQTKHSRQQTLFNTH